MRTQTTFRASSAPETSRSEAGSAGAVSGRRHATKATYAA